MQKQAHVTRTVRHIGDVLRAWAVQEVLLSASFSFSQSSLSLFFSLLSLLSLALSQLHVSSQSLTQTLQTATPAACKPLLYLEALAMHVAVPLAGMPCVSSTQHCLHVPYGTQCRRGVHVPMRASRGS